MHIMTTYHGYNNGYNTPVYNAPKNVGAHYPQQNTVQLILNTNSSIIEK